MENKELKKLSRAELIDIIYAMKQNELALTEQKTALEEQLSDRTIRLENAGSIAEAALSLNNVFEAAQRAADDYVTAVRSANANAVNFSIERVESEDLQADQIIAEAQAKADAINEQARKTSEACIRHTNEYCTALLKEAEEKRKATEAANEGMRQELEEKLAEVDAVRANLDAECAEKRAALQEECNLMVAVAEQQAKAKMDAVQQKLSAFKKQYQGLLAMMGAFADA